MYHILIPILIIASFALILGLSFLISVGQIPNPAAENSTKPSVTTPNNPLLAVPALTEGPLASQPLEPVRNTSPNSSSADSDLPICAANQLAVRVVSLPRIMPAPPFLQTPDIEFLKGRFQSLLHRDARGANDLLQTLLQYSYIDQIRFFHRSRSSRERTSDILPIYAALDSLPQSTLAKHLTAQLRQITEYDTRLGSEIIIDLKKIDLNHTPIVCEWLLSRNQGTVFCDKQYPDSHLAPVEKARKVVTDVIKELLVLFDEDPSISRGSFTIKGAEGRKLKRLFDQVVYADHGISRPSANFLDTIHEAQPIMASAGYLAGYSVNTTYNRSAAGSSSHYKGCKQYGIDIPPGMLPYEKQHILYGFTHNGEFWFKLEENGLGNVTSILAHAVDFVKTQMYPVAAEPSYK